MHNPLEKTTAAELNHRVAELSEIPGVLREESTLWQQALDGLPLGVAVLDATNETTLWVNRALQTLLETSAGANDIQGWAPYEYLPNLEQTAWQEARRDLDPLPPGQPLPRRRLQFVDQSTRNIAYWEWMVQKLSASAGSRYLMLTVQVVSEVVMNERLLAHAGRTADRARRRAEALVRMTQLVNASLTTPDLLRSLTRETAAYFDSPYASVLLLEPDQEHFEIGYSMGLLPTSQQGEHLRRSQTLAGQALAQRRTLAISDPAGHNIRTPRLENGEPPAALITSPIYQNDRAYGVVEIYFTQPRDVPDEALLLLTAYADQAAVALLKADLYEQIQEQRRQLQSIFDHAPVSIIYFNPEGRVVAANATAARRYGHSVEALLGRYHADFLDGTPPGMFDRAREGAPFHASHFVAHQPDGQEVVCDLSLVPVCDAEEQVAGLLLLSFDVTELVAARQEADRARRAAEDALAEVRATQTQMVQMEKMRALGELASGVAHDFNNALMAIMGYTALAEDDLSDPEALAGHLAIIRKAAQDASSTVQRLRLFAKQGSATHGVPTNINTVVKDVVEMTRPLWRDTAHKEGRTYNVQVHLNELPQIMSEPSGLREVLTNMVHNALNAMPGGGDLTLTTRLRGPHEIEVEIADTGAGMPPEVVARIFDPFFTTRGVEGTGLGLAVSWTIVQRHGGTIAVESTPGKGTRFFIRLPVRQVELTPAAEREAAPPVAPPDSCVLVVDDEPIVASVLASILSRQGYRVTVAYNGDEALERLREEPFAYQLVLTDHGMPGMNGLQLIAEIKRLRSDLPALLLTGWGETVMQTHVAESPPDAVLGKPINQSDLLTAIGKALEMKNQASSTD